MSRLIAVVVAVAVLALWVAPASAQSFNCHQWSTGDFDCNDFSGSNLHCHQWSGGDLSCNNLYTGASADPLLLALLLAQLQQAQQAQTPPRPGLDYNDGYGVPRWFPQGTFLKADDALAIYMIADQQFHAFQSWGSFLRHGGKADLSNVVRWNTVSNWPQSSFGTPVPD